MVELSRGARRSPGGAGAGRAACASRPARQSCRRWAERFDSGRSRRRRWSWACSRSRRRCGSGGGGRALPYPTPYPVLTVPGGAQPEVALELDMQRGPAREWVAQEPVQRKIGAVFRKFLRDFRDASGEYVYRQRMRDMVTSARRPACAPPALAAPAAGARAAGAPARGRRRPALGRMSGPRAPPCRGTHARALRTPSPPVSALRNGPPTCTQHLVSRLAAHGAKRSAPGGAAQATSRACTSATCT